MASVKENFMRWWKTKHSTIAFAATSFSSNAMHSIFMFHYVHIFLNHYHVSEQWFQFSQIVFMLWNALNDPLFGYMQDNCHLSFYRNRRHSILFGAPIFAISFLVPWFPWEDTSNGDSSWITGLHLVFALCFYDTLFTYVLLTHCCLMTEMSKNHEDRIERLQYSRVASILGSTSVLACELISDNVKNFANFQMACVVIGFLSWLCMTYTGLYCDTEYERDAVTQNHTDKVVHLDRSSKHSIWHLTWQIFSQRNFLAFVWTNFLNEFHLSFLSNFGKIIGDQLIVESTVSSSTRSIYYGLLFMLPNIIVVFGTPILYRLGYYVTYKWIFITKIIYSSLMFMVGIHQPWIFMFFGILESTSAGVGGNLMSLPLTDCVDADREKYDRSHPLSSMVFGTNALVTKPAISLAPMFAVKIFNWYGYEDLEKGTLSDVTSLQGVMFGMACAVPVVVGFTQSLLWSHYTIRHSHLKALSKDIEV